MTPPTVQFIPAPAVSGYQNLISGSTTSDVVNNYYVTHTNIDGDPIWDGRSPTQAFFIVNSVPQIQFYFANDTDRSAALAAYSLWRVVGTDGLSQVITPGIQSSSRLRWVLSSGSFSANTTYTIQGQA